MNKLILLLFFCFPFFLFSQQLQQSNDITRQDYAKEVQKTSYSEYVILIIGYGPIGFKLIITKREQNK